ncbi:hypothetical protein D3C71_1175780 [compost metagenome]
MRRAVFSSAATARMATPNRLRLRKNQKPASASSSTTITEIWLTRMPIPPRCTMVSAPATANFCGEAPQIRVTRERSITDRPTVTSTTDSTDSPSMGRMMSRSQIRPRSAPTTTATSTVSTAPVPRVTAIDQEV